MKNESAEPAERLDYTDHAELGLLEIPMGPTGLVAACLPASSLNVTMLTVDCCDEHRAAHALVAMNIGPTGVYVSMEANHLRATAAHLMKMADELDGGRTLN